VATYQGELINALYTSTCGGHTEDGANIFEEGAPYLTGVACAPERESWAQVRTSVAPRALGDDPDLTRSVALLSALGVLEPRGYEPSYLRGIPTDPEIRAWGIRVTAALKRSGCRGGPSGALARRGTFFEYLVGVLCLGGAGGSPSVGGRRSLSPAGRGPGGHSWRNGAACGGPPGLRGRLEPLPRQHASALRRDHASPGLSARGSGPREGGASRARQRQVRDLGARRLHGGRGGRASNSSAGSRGAAVPEPGRRHRRGVGDQPVPGRRGEGRAPRRPDRVPRGGADPARCRLRPGLAVLPLGSPHDAGRGGAGIGPLWARGHGSRSRPEEDRGVGSGGRARRAGHRGATCCSGA
jgi:hypothetical protein